MEAGAEMITDDFIEQVNFYLPDIPGINWVPLIRKHSALLLNSNCYAGCRNFNHEFAKRQSEDPILVAHKALAWGYVYPSDGIKNPKALAYHKRLAELVKQRYDSGYWGDWIR